MPEPRPLDLVRPVEVSRPSVDFLLRHFQLLLLQVFHHHLRVPELVGVQVAEGAGQVEEEVAAAGERHNLFFLLS